MSTTVKISELPVLASADAADEFVVVDDSAGETKKITFDSLATDVRTGAGPVTASTVTASTGITFGADTLDDYETGTWTPVIDNASGFNTTIATLTSATYTKIGQFVYVVARFVNGASGNIVAGDDIVLTQACLPFAPSAASTGGAVGVTGAQGSIATGEDVAMGYAGFSSGNNLGLLFHTVDGSVSRNNRMSLCVSYEV